MTRPTKRSVDSSPEEQKIQLEQLELYDREEVVQDAASSLPYGSEEAIAATKGFQPRSRLNNSRAKQFRSNEERVEYFKRTRTAQFRGKTYIPEHLLDTGDFFMWGCMTIRDQPRDDGMRQLEQIGFEGVTSDWAPELASWDYNGEVRDSVNFIEGGGLRLMVLDKELHAFEQEFQNQARKRQQVMRDNLNVPEPRAMRSPIPGARMHY